MDYPLLQPSGKVRGRLGFMENHEPQSDEWSRWLLHVRHGGDPELERAIRAELEAFADRVLDGARLEPGMTLADIGSGDPLRPLLHRWKAAQFPDTLEKMSASPLTNYSERTLFDLARASGFERIHAELHMDLSPSRMQTWEVFLETSPHPWAPPLSKILADQFTAAERALFEQSMRPMVESGRASSVVRTAFLQAVK
jgi:arsenite methyltransferase